MGRGARNERWKERLKLNKRDTRNGEARTMGQKTAARRDAETDQEMYREKIRIKRRRKRILRGEGRQATLAKKEGDAGPERVNYGGQVQDGQTKKIQVKCTDDAKVASPHTEPAGGRSR